MPAWPVSWQPLAGRQKFPRAVAEDRRPPSPRTPPFRPMKAGTCRPSGAELGGLPIQEPAQVSRCDPQGVDDAGVGLRILRQRLVEQVQLGAAEDESLPPVLRRELVKPGEAA